MNSKPQASNLVTSKDALSRPGPRPRTPVTPELVRMITDRVYSLLLRDLKIERERWRLFGGNRWR